ncbi:hypothetical protein BO70DRAFT_360193 [Aspergillus heteromorphus CBS 117.55]|uniref:Uncharacterized protein n=1 Tax=Aspergillus heteromorphus CBS 117.55 TaxID=1448321 RepID=A0A317WM59_9EURO|nr:uncharacterized protein BO70DRAFT_360193 [Aspergillus heteromorphus CBS 117.55]PWY87586.1 hypothetical protein BO70DRAFT_360193 [Aspergillus heteromorphus CBS 117.55]
MTRSRPSTAGLGASSQWPVALQNEVPVVLSQKFLGGGASMLHNKSTQGSRRRWDDPFSASPSTLTLYTTRTRPHTIYLEHAGEQVHCARSLPTTCDAGSVQSASQPISSAIPVSEVLLLSDDARHTCVGTSDDRHLVPSKSPICMPHEAKRYVELWPRTPLAQTAALGPG